MALPPVVIGLALSGVALAAAGAPKAAQGLQGRWQVVRADFDGETAPEAKLEKLKMSVEIKGDRLTFLIEGEKKPSRMVVRGRGKVQEIDLHPEGGKGFVVRGIYKMEGKQLWLCIDSDPEGKGRPKEFRSIAGTAIKLFVLEQKAP
jgi:uncharacterized protein (TIGR03067 family)